MEQAPCQHPDLLKRKVGIENMFVDKEAILPHNHQIPTGNGKIGAVGKVEIIQALHQEGGEGRTKFPSQQNGRPVHSRSRTWNATRLGETEMRDVTVPLKSFLRVQCVAQIRTQSTLHIHSG